jgi:phosphopantothenoylcysteine decarboxylase/phosphopantothenate--cysteine ligase
MGYALARMSRRRGAEVILVAGPTSLPPPRRDIKFIPIRSAEEMRKAVFAHLRECSVVIKAAAVSDYRSKVISRQKIKKGDSDTTLALERTKDILGELGRNKEDRILIGFAAETEDLISNAKKKLEEKNLDLIVINDVAKPGAGFGGDTNQVSMLYPSGKVRNLPLLTKEEVSSILLDEVVKLLRKKRRFQGKPH